MTYGEIPKRQAPSGGRWQAAGPNKVCCTTELHGCTYCRASERQTYMRHEYGRLASRAVDVHRGLEDDGHDEPVRARHGEPAFRVMFHLQGIAAQRLPWTDISTDGAAAHVHATTTWCVVTIVVKAALSPSRGQFFERQFFTFKSFQNRKISFTSANNLIFCPFLPACLGWPISPRLQIGNSRLNRQFSFTFGTKKLTSEILIHSLLLRLLLLGLLFRVSLPAPPSAKCGFVQFNSPKQTHCLLSHDTRAAYLSSQCKCHSKGVNAFSKEGRKEGRKGHSSERKRQ